MDGTINDPWISIRKVNAFILEPFEEKYGEITGSKAKLIITLQSATIETTLYFYVTDKERPYR